MNVVEKTGKTVEDAVQAALAELGVSREQVDVEVLEASKSSILGLFGGRDAKVRVTVRVTVREEIPAEPETALRKNQLKQRKPNRRQMTEAEILLQNGKKNARKRQRWPRLFWKTSLQPWEWICSSKSSSAEKRMRSS